MRTPMLALVLLLSAHVTSAQSLTYGVKAGVNLSKVALDADGGGENPYESRVGFLGGAFATLRVGRWIWIQPEAIYTIKGAALDVAGVESQLILDYLEVPLLARAAVGRGIYAVAGPTLAVRLRARSRTRFGGSTEEIDIDDEIRRVDVGLAAGAGIELGSWLFEGRYTHGSSNIDAESDEGARLRNRTLSLSAGVRF